MPTTYGYLHLENRTPAEAASILWMRGYRQVSRTWRHIARVDVKDDVIRQQLHIPDDKPLDWSDYDYCRRCISKDVIVDVPEAVMVNLRLAGGIYDYRRS